MKDGVFLIRESDMRPGEFAIALKYVCVWCPVDGPALCESCADGTKCLNTSKSASIQTPESSMYLTSVNFYQLR